jgi:hypothetical protein
LWIYVLCQIWEILNYFFFKYCSSNFTFWHSEFMSVFCGWGNITLYSRPLNCNPPAWQVLGLEACTSIPGLNWYPFSLPFYSTCIKDFSHVLHLIFHLYWILHNFLRKIFQFTNYLFSFSLICF